MQKQILIAKLFNIDPLDVALKKYQLDPTQELLLRNKLKLLKSGIPIDYLIGKINILGLEISLNQNALIPREETEFWLIKYKDIIQNKTPKNSTILVDLGTGSGIIGMYLSEFYKKVIMMDVDPNTLIVANQNINQNKITNCKTILNDGLNKISFDDSKENWDLIANLPYLPSGDIAFENQNKIQYEPKIALYSGFDGLELFNQVITQLQLLTNKPDTILLELDPRNIQKAKTTIEKLDYKTEIWLDQNNLQRTLYCQKN